jgi:hydrogenase small subunit
MGKLSRRDFIKLGATAGLLASLNWSALVKAFGDAVRDGQINLVWFEAQDCAGNTTSIIQATDPSLTDVLLGTTPLVGPGTVRLIFHETVMPQWGAVEVQTPSQAEQQPSIWQTSPPPGTAVKILEDLAAGKYGPYVLILEGSFPQDYQGGMFESNGFYCAIGPYTCTEWLKKLLTNALAVVAVGNCASYGGIPANKILEPPPMFSTVQPLTWNPNNVTGAIGFFDDPVKGIKGAIHQDYFQPEVEPFRKYIDEGGVPDFATIKPAVAVPGCPANGNGMLRTIALMALVALGVLPASVLDRKSFLDEYARPLFIFQNTVHEQCPRAAWYAAGVYREYPGQPNAACLYSVGCKGPWSHCPWNKVGWVAGVGGPTRTGGVCIGCTQPGFTDHFEPFYEPMNFTPVGRSAAADVALGVGIGGIVAGAIAAAATALSKKKEGEGEKKEQK